MSLQVDEVKPAGYGMLCNGNSLTKNQHARIIDLPIFVTLQTLSSGYNVNEIASDVYAVGTARLSMAKYQQHYVPSSVHEVLIYRSQIILLATLPIFRLSQRQTNSFQKIMPRNSLGYQQEPALLSYLISSQYQSETYATKVITFGRY